MDAFVDGEKALSREAQGAARATARRTSAIASFLSLMSDPLPYGMAANRASIEALVTYSLQQKLIPSRPQLDQVFVEIDP